MRSGRRTSGRAMRWGGRFWGRRRRFRASTSRLSVRFLCGTDSRRGIWSSRLREIWIMMLLLPRWRESSARWLPAAMSVAAKVAAPKATPHITLKRKKSLEQVQFCLGSTGSAGERSAALWGVSAEYDAGRRDEFAAVPDDPRGRGTGLLDLLGDESVSRYGLAVRLCGNLGR